MIIRHGLNATYHVINQGTYNPATGSVSNTETSKTIKVYKKHITANQYNYPNLIGKELAEFYVASDALSSRPKVNDAITFNGDKYRITEFREHSAGGIICLYCLIGVKQ